MVTLAIDRDVFFDGVRASLFNGAMTAAQVRGLTFKLDAWDNFAHNSDPRWLAYALATAYHETGRTMQPITEKGGIAYFHKMYDRDGDRPNVARALGNTQQGDGIRYAGRGDVQLTGRNNYAKATRALGRDFVGRPSDVLIPDVSATIMYHGMYAGWFTGKDFADYFAGAKADWYGARRIINGTDKAEDIARYAKRFYAAILSAQVEDAPTPDGKPVLLSTTNMAAAGLTFSGATATVSAVRDGIGQATALAADTKQIVPWFGMNQHTLIAALGVVIILLAVYIIKERIAKRSLGV